MNFPRILIVVVSLFGIIEDIISLEDAYLDKDIPGAPLALIKDRNLTLQLAIPHKHKYKKNVANYFYDDSKDENGNREEFVIACPAHTNTDAFRLEEYLKNNNELSEDGKLFVTFKYYDYNIQCSRNVVPSIQKEEKKDSNGNTEYCGQSEAEIYNVGYPILKDNEKEDIQFISIYKICFSTAEGKGTLYTIHQIISPELLLQELWEFYTIDPKFLLKSSLDRSEKEKKLLYKNRYAYHIVGFDDMPTDPRKRTTSFHFNHISIPKNKDLLTSMIAVDNYIRLFSKETNKKLTLYSGTYQKEVPTPPHFSCLAPLCKPKPTLLNSFWRIIKDDEGYAMIVVTQYTLMKCNKDSYICQKSLAIVQEYEKGGCTYTCLVNEDITDLLGLPPLAIAGILPITFPQKMSTSDTQSHAVNPFKVYSILDFMEKGKFMNALANADPDLAADVQVQSTTDERSYVDKEQSNQIQIKCVATGRIGCFGGGGGGGGGGGSGGGTSWLMFGGGGVGYVGSDYGGNDGGVVGGD